MITCLRPVRIAATALPLLLILVFSAVAQATDYTVDTNVDSPIATPGSTACVDAESVPKCSIRAAIDAANSHAGDDRVLIPPDRYDRTNAPDGPNDNSTGDFNVGNNGALTIQGLSGDPKDVIISAAGIDRVLEIDDGGTLTVAGVTLQDGFTGGDGAG